MVESRLESLILRLESAVARQEALVGGSAAVAPAQAKASDCKLAKEFVALIEPKIKAVKDAAAALGIA